MAGNALSLNLSTPTMFPKFPYDAPYDIQVSLMRHIYTSIEERKVAIVESPTGTGKTSSLLCASLTWLDDNQERAQKGELDAISGGDGPDWVLSQTRDRLKRELEAYGREYEERLAKARKREEAQRRMSSARVRKKQKRTTTETDSDPEDTYLPEDGDDHVDSQCVSSSSLSMDAEERKPTCTKVFYASRTHSQLSQVVPELRKLRRFVRPPTSGSIASSKGSLSANADSCTRKRAYGDDDGSSVDLSRDHDQQQSRVVTLGSRKQLCINDELRAKSGDLDENCRDLLQANDEKRCPYLPKMGEDGRLHDLRDQILAAPKDIEDLVAAGQAARTCPYFASRDAISQAEVVTLPYNLLLQQSAREALNISLEGHVVVVDEAHNLISTLLSLSTVSLSLKVLDLSLAQLSLYLSKFKNRLASRHSLHLQRLYLLLNGLKTLMVSWSKHGLPEVTTVLEVLHKLGRSLEGVNVLEIQKYLRESKVAKKIAMFSKHQHDKDATKGNAQRISYPSNPPLYIIQSFIAALAEANEDGRIIMSVPEDDPQKMEIKYQSLNPSSFFRPVVDTARAVILAGGTMSPMSDFVNQLFLHIPQERISMFSCGHIIPETNLQTLVLGRGPRGQDLSFKFANMSEQSVTTELGQILLNFARIVPGGLVVFLPSYRMLHHAMKAWKESKLYDNLNAKKKVFVEPSSAADVPVVLHEYASEVQGSKAGAMMFAVIGAKLSEGLNFSDDLARMVVVVGLPFANLGSAELLERLKYADRLAGQPVPANARYGAAGRELYENMCMNAINQSIGRAIRHKEDWAALLLVDIRYQSERISKKLPKWIGQSLVSAQTFGQAVKFITHFFNNKKRISS